MLRKTAIAHFGNQTKVAEALGLSPAAVSLWDDVIPEGSAYKLQVITGGALRVDQSKYKKRPKRGQTLAAATS